MKVLVVDDLPVFREPIETCLRVGGFETCSAGDGEEALQVARTHRPDVILLDLSMPRMDGLTFLKRLRAEPAIANTRVILLTARSERQFVLAAAQLGVRDFLLKSRFRLQDLMQRIGKAGDPQPAALPAPVAKPPPVANPSPISKTTPTVTSGHGTAGRVPPQSSAPAHARGTAPAATPGGPAAATPAKQASEPAAPVLSREAFLARVERAAGPRTLSGVVAQVITLAASPRGDTQQLAALIARDPMLSARVIRAANGAAYLSHGGIVTTIPDAIRKVGCNTVRNIAAALGVFDSLPDETADGFNLVRCWQHSFAVAQFSEKLAATHAPENAGIAYVVGLCHDLGEIFLRTHFAPECQKLHETRGHTGLPADRLYREMFGMSYGQMVGAILRSIGLPELIREPIEAFHSRPRSRADDATVKTLWIAENCANAAMIASWPGAEIAPLTEPYCRLAVGDAHPAPPDPQLLRSEVLTLTMTLANASRADEDKLLTPMFPRHEASIWLARAPGVSRCDPVAMVLSELTRVEVSDRLPSAEEAGASDAIVVVAPTPDARGFGEAQLGALTGGGTGSLLAIGADLKSAAQQVRSVQWRESVSLAELAQFVERAGAARQRRAAA